jgi:hypothetical protein
MVASMLALVVNGFRARSFTRALVYSRPGMTAQADRDDLRSRPPSKQAALEAGSASVRVED